jgi:protein-L-isoaspartate(D-aspartate) O-methyltransferase
MTSEKDLTVVRRAYAKQILAAASVSDHRIEDAFAAVRREAYLGPGPWQVLRFLRKYVPTPTADPVYLYTDDLVGSIRSDGSITASHRCTRI